MIGRKKIMIRERGNKEMLEDVRMVGGNEETGKHYKEMWKDWSQTFVYRGYGHVVQGKIK